MLFFMIQALQSRLNNVEHGVTDVGHKGDELSELVGESEQPIVSTSVSGVNSEYDNLKDTWRQRHDELQAALEQTNKFQQELVGILNWLQGRTSRVLISSLIRHGTLVMWW